MFKKSLMFGLVVIFAGLLSVSAAAQGVVKGSPAPGSEGPKKAADSPIVANWDVTVTAPGQELPGMLKLEKDGDGFKGALVTDMGEAPLKNIKITEDSFTSEMTAIIQGQTFEGTMSGKLADGKLTGEINLSGIGAIPYTGQKSTGK